jgi:thymidylate synthase (FAD)
MIIQNPTAILMETSPAGYEALRVIEIFGRISYKSEDRITNESAPRFVKMLIKDGHESVLEHVSATVKFIVDRGVSHEIVRHRIAAYTQESTRYCDYNKKGDVVFIRPPFWEENSRPYQLWLDVMEHSEQNYKGLIALGAKPQEARSVLPNSLKTELMMTANIREWRHFFTLRTASAAHPQMREVTIPLLSRFKLTFPVLFDDIVPK